jgi:CBS domain-containing protein
MGERQRARCEGGVEMKADEGTTAVSEQSADEAVSPVSGDGDAAAGDPVEEWESTEAEEDQKDQREDRRRARENRARERTALAGALVFLLLGFAAIYVVVKVAGERDGTVLAALLIIPALLYLLLSGQVKDLKGPAGLELTLAEVANQNIPLPDEADSTRELSFEKVAAIEKGRTATLDERIRTIPPNAPVVLTFTLGSDIDGPHAANYARRLTQLRRFRYIAILDSKGKLVSYMEEAAFRHIIDATDPSAVASGMTLINNIREKHIGDVMEFPGMILHRVSPRTTIVQALRKMERTHLNALLVVEKGAIVGIAERDHLANQLLLSLIDRASGGPRSQPGRLNA